MSNGFYVAVDGTGDGRNTWRNPRSAERLDHRGLIITPVPVVAILLGLGASANAQAIPWTKEEIASPWNTQQIFEPIARPT